MGKTPVYNLFLLFFCLYSLCFSQNEDDPLISATFQSQNLNEIFSSLESSYPAKFYWTIDDLPSEKYTFSFEDMTLIEVLEKVLAPTDLSFLIYRDFLVVVAPREEIQKEYSINYYSVWAESLNKGPEEEREEQTIVGQIDLLKPDGRALITGRVLAKESGNPLENARVSLKENAFQVETDSRGVFQVNLPAGEYHFIIERLGYDSREVKAYIYSDGTLELPISSKTYELETVVMEAVSPEEVLNSAQIGVTRLNMERIRKLPSFLGEVDVVKGLLLQPGVTTVGEASTGFNVRGGNADQNLLLQDGAMIFNSSHALGLFSTFNTDLVQQVNLYKGNIPAKYGGRIASVLDVKLKNGSYNKWLLSGGIGPVSSRLSLEGPLIKDKTSILLGLRSTYSDWVLQRVNNPDVQNSSAFFLDGNIKISHRLNDITQLSLSGYYSEDDFSFAEDFGFAYQTQLANLELVSQWESSLRSEFSLVGSQYESTQKDITGDDASNWTTGLQYLQLKEILSHQLFPQMKGSLGLEGTYYRVLPERIGPATQTSLVLPNELDEEKGIELGFSAGIEWTLSERFSLLAGARLNYFSFLESGMEEDFLYAEPRVSFNYKLSDRVALKAGYSRTSQFVNQISQLDSPTPTNVWQLANSQVAPFRSHNTSLGLFRNSINNMWETSVEAYYRGIDVLYDYMDFAQLVMNPNLEEELAEGEGRAYGLELSIKKNSGALTGWLSYTLSRTERSVPEINTGSWYPSNFDKTHEVTWVSTYQINRRHGISVNFTYGTGRPTTIPVGSFRTSSGLFIPDYSLRNQERIPDYHRLDVSYTLGRGYKKDRKFDTSWTLSLYNVYGRRNAYSVFYVQEPFQPSQAFRLSILGGIFPALTYNFKMR